MNKKLFLLSLLGLIPALTLSPQLVLAADTGSALKADSLRAEPFNDAKTVGNLARGDALEIIVKKGAWLQVKTVKSTGWVRILSVKRGTINTTSNTKDVLDLASGRSGTGQVVSTTGVRGLSAEELKGAKFNEEEMKAMESYTQSAAEGKKFADAGKLQAMKFSYFSSKGAK